MTRPPFDSSAPVSIWFRGAVWLCCLLTLLTLCPQFVLAPNRAGGLVLRVVPSTEGSAPVEDEEEDESTEFKVASPFQAHRHSRGRRIPAVSTPLHGHLRTASPRAHDPLSAPSRRTAYQWGSALLPLRC